MARLTVEGDELIVGLRALEQFAAWRRRVRVPLDAVRVVRVVDRPWDSLLLTAIRLGFAGSTAPGQA